MRTLIAIALLLCSCASQTTQPPPPPGVYCPTLMCPNDAGAPCVEWEGDYCVRWEQQQPPDAGQDAPEDAPGCIMSAPDVCID